MGQSVAVKPLNSDLYQPISERASTASDADAAVPTTNVPSLIDESKSSFSALLQPPLPTALTSRDPRKFGVIDTAYLDAFTILNDDNPCSRFFGGRHATAALTELVRQLKPRYIDPHIAIRMSGEITTVQSQLTGFSFRLFKKAELNLGGTFFRDNGLASITTTFRPSSRETRVVVLLHELGHLVKTPAEDRWVLPDDGSSSSLSFENTAQVVSVCRQQIESLSKLTPTQELEMTLSAEQAQFVPR